MHEAEKLARRFEAHRGQLGSLAYRMLGSHAEAEDAVQETWIRLGRVDATEIANLAGWLRTTTTRICLDLLRARRSRREELAGNQMSDQIRAQDGDPEDEALLADSVSRALLVVLDTLNPTERIAFVLHDMFAVPFEQIAPVVRRSPGAAKQLASRARRKVQGVALSPGAELDRQRTVVAAFLDAAREGDLAGILAVLDPDVLRRADAAALPPGVPAEVRGARAVAEGTVALAARPRFAEPALINGAVGVVVAPRGRLLFALTFVIKDQRITEYEVIADPERLARLNLAVIESDPDAAT